MSGSLVVTISRANSYQHVVADDFDFVGHGGLGGRHGQGPAVADVELRPVPRAGDRKAVQLPFAQRAAVVRADVVERVELARRRGTRRPAARRPRRSAGRDREFRRPWRRERNRTCGIECMTKWCTKLACGVPNRHRDVDRDASRPSSAFISRIRESAGRSPRPAPRARFRS